MAGNMNPFNFIVPTPKPILKLAPIFKMPFSKQRSNPKEVEVKPLISINHQAHSSNGRWKENEPGYRAVAFDRQYSTANIWLKPLNKRGGWTTSGIGNDSKANSSSLLASETYPNKQANDDFDEYEISMTESELENLEKKGLLKHDMT